MAHRWEGKWLSYPISSADFSTEPPNPPSQLLANQSGSSTKNSGKAKKPTAGSPPREGAGLNSSSSGSSVASVRSHYPIGDCLRIQGPATIKTGEAEAGPLDYLPQNLMERLEFLAYGQKAIIRNRAPLEAYTTHADETGIVYRATAEFVRWHNTHYGIADDRVPTPRTETPISAGEPRKDEPKPEHWRGKRMKASD